MTCIVGGNGLFDFIYHEMMFPSQEFTEKASTVFYALSRLPQWGEVEKRKAVVQNVSEEEDHTEYDFTPNWFNHHTFKHLYICLDFLFCCLFGAVVESKHDNLWHETGAASEARSTDSKCLHNAYKIL